MNTNTITQSVALAFIAAGVDLSETFPGGVTIVPDEGTVTAPTVSAPKAKVDGRNHAARKHNYEARIARREDPKNAANAKGLTKGEKSALYAAHPELSAMTPAKRKAAWNKIVAAYKAAN
jgi:hypothetical protein